MKKLFCFALFFTLLVTSLSSASIDINPSNAELEKEVEITIDMNSYGNYVYFYDGAENMVSSYSLGCVDNLCSKKISFNYVINDRDFDLGNYKLAVYSHDDNKWLFSDFEVVEYKCSDGTLVGDCSITKPKYCGEGEVLVDDCSECGCSDGYECSEGKCVEVEEVIETVGINESIEITVKTNESINTEIPDFERLYLESEVVSDQINPFHGYIIELEGEPLTVESVELEKQGEDNEDSFVKKTLSRILPRGIAPTTFTNIEKKLGDRKNNLGKERENFKQRALDKLNKVSIITGNVVAGSEDNLIVLAEYENVFNGLALDVTGEEAEEIKKIKGVESVTPNYFVNITLMDSIPKINADDVWKLDRDGNNCDETGKECLTGKGITIGIIDTGVDYTHEDLGGCNPFSEIIGGDIEGYPLESPHPYEDNYDNIWEITKPGFTEIAVHFDKIEVESKYDFVNILNGDDEIVQTFYGYHQDLWSDSIKGDTIKIQLVADAYLVKWGFEIDKIINGHVENLMNWSVCDKVVGGYDFVNGDEDPMDDHGHGTHCAATAAGDGVLKGVAFDADIYAYKVLSAEGEGDSSGIISAIERTVDPNQDGNFSDHLDIISLSLGGPGNPNDPSSKAIDRAVDIGVVAVVAAGNHGPREESIGSPGTARKAITVGASDKYDSIARFSSRGPVIWRDSDGNVQYLLKPDIVAPGVGICAAQWEDAFLDYGANQCIDNEHVAISGTSMATPHVAGAVALLLEKNPDWTPEEIKVSLKGTAVDIGPETICDDGIDGDNDGLIDCKDDDCNWKEGCMETICDDGIDNNKDGDIDCDDDDCMWDDACRENICDDGIDNEGDGDTDCDDNDCRWEEPCTETICDDGIDNEGDGLTDCKDDDCRWDDACRENICDDGIDNEGDGDTDCNDDDCMWDDACRENICDDGIDNNKDGDIDCDDDDCMWDDACRENICDDGIDNDEDGLIDCEDYDCRYNRNCMENICDDGIDDNNNGLTDCDDDDCKWDNICRENICDDGIDNEGDGLIDCEDAWNCFNADNCLIQGCKEATYYGNVDDPLVEGSTVDGPGWWTFDYDGLSEVVTISLCGSDFDTALALLKEDCESLEVLEESYDSDECGHQSVISIKGLDTGKYRIIIFGDEEDAYYNGEPWRGNYKLDISSEAVVKESSVRLAWFNSPMSLLDVLKNNVVGAKSILSGNFDWSPEEIKTNLKDASVDVGEGVTIQGYGRIDILKAVELDAPINNLWEFMMTSPRGENAYKGELITIKGIFPQTYDSLNVQYALKSDPYNWKTDGIVVLGEDDIIAEFDSSVLDGEDTIMLKIEIIKDGIARKDEAIINIIDKGPGWPKNLYDLILSHPLVVDLEGDGEKEIIINTISGKVYLLDTDGSFREEWAIPYFGGYTQSSVADIDNDGVKEIVVAGWKGIYILNKDGTFYLGGGTGWPKNIYTHNSATLVDIVGNKDIEIIVPAAFGSFFPDRYSKINYLYALNSDGTSVDGWPQFSGNSDAYFSEVSVGDVNQDGSLNIVTGTSGGSWQDRSTELMSVFIFNNDGSLVDNWPQETIGWVEAPPVIGDINNDGNLDIVAVAGGGVYAWNSDGTLVDGWPVKLPNLNTGVPPVLGDFNRDGYLEIVFTTFTPASDSTNDGKTYLYNSDGTLVDGWPIISRSADKPSVFGNFDEDLELEIAVVAGHSIFIYNSDGSLVSEFPPFPDSLYYGASRVPSLVFGDIDNDMKNELFYSDISGYLNLIDFDVPYNPEAMDWPMFQHDAQRTGLYISYGEEVCDELDNDRDREVDEDFTNLKDSCFVGVGECVNEGNYICSEDGFETKCDAVAKEPIDEECDGLDNDCDGETDEDFTNLGNSCSVGIGECVNEGNYICSEDGFETKCSAITGDPIVEIYDGLDNDCDGEIDEGAIIGGELDCSLKDKVCFIDDNCCDQEDGCHLFACGLKDKGDVCFTNNDCSESLRCNWYKCEECYTSGIKVGGLTFKSKNDCCNGWEWKTKNVCRFGKGGGCKWYSHTKIVNDYKVCK